uniref:Uncharacterized protein n=1 Tax=Cajanus cajan TaxID=3821 RepID=A0A151QWS2_CAJCA|nr:hypothetical protein KK1_044328 [Cajanus cajan]
MASPGPVFSFLGLPPLPHTQLKKLDFQLCVVLWLYVESNILGTLKTFKLLILFTKIFIVDSFVIQEYGTNQMIDVGHESQGQLFRNTTVCIFCSFLYQDIFIFFSLFPGNFLVIHFHAAKSQI